jgi:hypothetical protein
MENNESYTIWILEYISRHNGLTFTQIQKALWNMSHNSNAEPFTRKSRGWWCTQLLGSPYNHDGLLHTFCEKRNGKWYRNNIQHGKHPWTCVKKYIPNIVKKSVCPYCGK